jgi:hypothetical protein
MSVDGRSTLAALLGDQRALEARVHDLRANPRETLAFGEALLAFAAKETEVFSVLAPLLDPAVETELGAEHRQFAEDLELLDWLLRITPESPDVAVLTESLLCRMRQHIDRDGRLLARAAILAART